MSAETDCRACGHDAFEHGTVFVNGDPTTLLGRCYHLGCTCYEYVRPTTTKGQGR